MEIRISLYTATAIVSLNPYYNGRYSWRIATSLSEVLKLAVLILIIMEDTHGEAGFSTSCCGRGVLILIIMEDTHGDMIIGHEQIECEES